MTQQGTHTWDLELHYHRCPKCGCILESRKGYGYRLGKYVKDLDCPRCHHRFQVTKTFHPRWGPLIGEAQPIEMEWD